MFALKLFLLSKWTNKNWIIRVFQNSPSCKHDFQSCICSIPKPFSVRLNETPLYKRKSFLILSYYIFIYSFDSTYLCHQMTIGHRCRPKLNNDHRLEKLGNINKYGKIQFKQNLWCLPNNTIMLRTSDMMITFTKKLLLKSIPEHFIIAVSQYLEYMIF